MANLMFVEADGGIQFVFDSASIVNKDLVSPTPYLFIYCID